MVIIESTQQRPMIALPLITYSPPLTTKHIIVLPARMYSNAADYGDILNDLTVHDRLQSFYFIFRSFLREYDDRIRMVVKLFSVFVTF